MDDDVKAKTVPLMERVFASPLETQQALNCGHDKVYQLIKKRELDAFKDGTRTKITVASIKRVAASLPRFTGGVKVGRRRAGK